MKARNVFFVLFILCLLGFFSMLFLGFDDYQVTFQGKYIEPGSKYGGDPVGIFLVNQTSRMVSSEITWVTYHEAALGDQYILSLKKLDAEGDWFYENMLKVFGFPALIFAFIAAYLYLREYAVS